MPPTVSDTAPAADLVPLDAADIAEEAVPAPER
jgi:hypothetical protein